MSKVVCFLLLSFILSGCWGVNSEFISLRKDVLRNSGISEFEKTVEFSVNKLNLFMVEKFVSLDISKMDWEIILSNISKVQLGVYNLNFDSDPKNLNVKLNSYLGAKGWSNLITQKEGDQINLIYLNTTIPENINEMLLVVLDDEEIILINIKGKLRRVIEYAIRNRGIKV